MMTALWRAIMAKTVMKKTPSKTKATTEMMTMKRAVHVPTYIVIFPKTVRQRCANDSDEDAASGQVDSPLMLKAKQYADTYRTDEDERPGGSTDEDEQVEDEEEDVEEEPFDITKYDVIDTSKYDMPTKRKILEYLNAHPEYLEQLEQELAT